MEVSLTKAMVLKGDDVSEAIISLSEMGPIDVDMFWAQVEFQRTNGKPYWNVEMKPWFRRRSTGVKSQNNHLWGHATQIAMYHGSSVRAIVSWAEIFAMDNFGYTYTVVGKERIPKHHKETDIKEFGLLIDALHYRADEDHIKLKEGWND